jgi:hypothetical protein
MESSTDHDRPHGVTDAPRPKFVMPEVILSEHADPNEVRGAGARTNGP